jgi:hypothetical protein
MAHTFPPGSITHQSRPKRRDLTQEDLGTMRAIKRAAHGQYWVCLCEKGHTVSILAGTLHVAANHGRTPTCPACKAEGKAKP